MDPKAKGSFVSPAKVESDLSGKRMEAAAAKEKAERATASSDSAETDDTAKEAREAAGLPDTILSAVDNREMPFLEFRGKYKAIFDQVQDKVHLSRGCVSFKTTVARGQTVGITTLSSGQQKIVHHLSKATKTGLSTGVVQDEFYRWTLLFSLVEYGAQNVSVPKPPRVFSSGPLADKSEEALLEYLNNTEVVEKLERLDDISAMVHSEIVNVAIDVMTAGSLAIREDMVNP